MKIITEKEKILHQKLTPVDDITPQIQALIEDMKKSMIAARGIGLAANQVDRDLRLFVIDKEIAEQNAVPQVYINPEITEYSDEKSTAEEGCLSIPGHWQQVTRRKKLKLKALDETGKKIKIKARGLLARILQHEFDHLEGILINTKKQD